MADIPADCVFCDLPRFVKQYSPSLSYYNGFPIHYVVPINPVTKGHLLVVPTQHVEHAATLPKLTGAVMEAAAKLAGDHESANIITSIGVPRRKNDGLQLPWSLQQEREAARKAAPIFRDIWS